MWIKFDRNILPSNLHLSVKFGRDCASSHPITPVCFLSPQVTLMELYLPKISVLYDISLPSAKFVIEKLSPTKMGTSNGSECNPGLTAHYPFYYTYVVNPIGNHRVVSLLAITINIHTQITLYLVV